ncbi:MAG: glycosyltransferase, partial [FCB group bacterium]|nr:glycosyltransferase [FCB group bacterium]
FGGEVITHARDPQVLTAKFDKTELKKRLGLAEDVFLIGHLGSYRPHKGLDRIVEAQDILNDDNIYFLYSANHDVLPKRKNIIRINEFPMNILPDILGACDLAVFPLLDNDISRYQFPAKIVDAMMLGIPFLVSNTEAIGEQLTPPEYLIDINITAAELAQRIKFVKEQKSLYSELADEMQNKAIAEYSVSFCANKLKDILNLMIDDKELS